MHLLSFSDYRLIALCLLQVCVILAARTMCKRRNDPRNHLRNDVTGELQAQPAGVIIYL
jgi:hypothetical protein